MLATTTAAMAAEQLIVPRAPASLDATPPHFALNAREAIARAAAVDKVQREARKGRLAARPYLVGRSSWRIDFVRGPTRVAEVHLDGRTGAVTAAYTGPEVAWELARGAHGPSARRLNALLALCGLAFLLPFFDPRRLWRILHLDLLALSAGFGLA